MKIQCPYCKLIVEFIKTSIDFGVYCMCPECEYDMQRETYDRIVELEKQLLTAREERNALQRQCDDDGRLDGEFAELKKKIEEAPFAVFKGSEIDTEPGRIIEDGAYKLIAIAGKECAE